MREKYFIYLDKKKETVLAEIAKLESEQRKDESNILKAKANIYDIAKAVYDSAQTMAEGDVKKILHIFSEKLEVISTPWRLSLDKAKEFGDSRKELIESGKLDALSDCMDTLKSMEKEN